MVLGVSELKGKALKKIKAYGFTKYHQKLMKDTDYRFLDLIDNNIQFNNNLIKATKKDDSHTFEMDSLPKVKSNKEVAREYVDENSKIPKKIIFWGHSLDVSDQDYIKKIFSFNQNEDQYVRVTVFYFDNNAKFSLLANLLHILGKEKVEHWMKQGWLIFKPNPDVAQLNQIQPIELVKNES